LVRLGLAIFFTMNVAMFTMVLWTEDLYPQQIAAGGRLATSLSDLLRYLCLIASLPVALLLGGPLAQNAWSELCAGRLSTDLLLTLGVGGAFAYSIVSVVSGTGHLYFEVGCVVLVLLTIGRWLEATGRLRASSALDALGQLLPTRVHKLMTDSGNSSEIDFPLESVVAGDRLRVLPGERIPTDGILQGIATSIDEQILTGESHPVVKEPGDHLWGGTLNLDGDIVLQVTAPPAAGALQRLIDAVRQARHAKGHYERLADRLSARFVPLMVFLAIVTGVYHGLHGGLEQAWMSSLAVLLIACPCALGLATPMAVWSALGRAAQTHVLFRDGEALERLAGVRVVCFDKTGTLTQGSHQIDRVQSAADAPTAEVLTRSLSLARLSQHPLSRALARHAANQTPHSTSSQIELAPGRGITGLQPHVGGPPVRVWLGSPRWMQELDFHCDPDLEKGIHRGIAAGVPLACVAWQGSVRGLFLFREFLRPAAQTAIHSCRQLGLNVVVLTGDHSQRAAELAQQLSVPVHASLLPADKLRLVNRYRLEFGPVAMIGDGMNDAPALAGADVGVSLGSAADLSRNSGQVCLLKDDLLTLPWSIQLARLAHRVVRQNLLWAFGYNAIGVGLAMAGSLNPIAASLLMVASSALVVANTRRIALFPDPHATTSNVAPTPDLPPIRPRWAEVLT
jgi:heavy metal translocating P-type ATPase